MRLSMKTLCLSLVGSAVLLALGATVPARAEVSVNINLGPPPIVVAEPPEVVVIPESRVYFVPDPRVDVFFFNGYWWSPRGDRWYRSRAYNGPWGVIERRYVPRAVMYVPPDYRDRWGRDRHVPYGQWKKDHDRWDRENRQSHRKWEKEREKEWKQRGKEDRKERRHEDGDDRHGGGDEGRGRGHRD